MRYLATLFGCLLFWASPVFASDPIVVTFGDSLSYAGVGNEYSYVQLLSAHYKVVNQSHAGDTSADQETVLDTYIAAGSPMDIGVVVVGTNDSGSAVTDVDETVSNIMSMASKISGYGAIPLVVSPPPLSEGGATSRTAWVAAIPALLSEATSAADVDYVDAYAAFIAYDSTAEMDDLYYYYDCDIASIADAGGGSVTVTCSAAHGYSNGHFIDISGTTAGQYDGDDYLISNASGTDFDIVHAWLGTDTGTARREDHIHINPAGDFLLANTVRPALDALVPAP